MTTIAILNVDTGRSVLIDLDTFAVHEPNLDAPPADPRPAGDDSRLYDGTYAAEAEREAQEAAGAPPPPQPADTDPTASPGPTPSGSTTDGSNRPTASDDYTTTSPPATEDPTAGPAPGAAAQPPDTAGTAGPANGEAPTTPTRTTPQTTETDCPACQGTGNMTWQDENGGTTAQQCGMCHGAGKIRVPA